MADSSAGYSADHYVHRLDLGEDPFADDFKSDFFYSTASRSELLDQLIHFCRYSDQLVVLVGATGVGTSSILDQAILQLRDTMDCCYVNAEVMLSPEQVLESLCEQLQLNLDIPVETHDFFATLKMAISSDYDAEPILLAVDQAHYLPIETYELLKTISASAGDLFRLLLVGEYQTEQLINLARFDKDQIKVLELEALSRLELGGYLLGLLQSVGYAGEQPFNGDQLSVLYDQSSGSLSEVKQLAPALLNTGLSTPKSPFKFGMPMTHLAAVMIIVVALWIVWAYQGDVEVESPPLPVIVQDNQPNQTTSDVPDDTKKAVESQPATLELLEPVSLTNDDSAVVANEKIEPNVMISETIPYDNPQVQLETTIDDPVQKNREPITVEADSRLDEQADAPVLPQARVLETKSEANGSDSSSPLKSESKPASLSHREKRLLAFEDSNYVLQLMGAVDEQRVKQFVKQYIGRLPITYFKRQLKGKPWFVAVVGPFSTRAEAVNQINALPVEIRKLGPWPKSVASVKKDILAN